MTNEARSLYTHKLLLRLWREEDAAALQAAFGDPATMRFWDTPPLRSTAELAARIRQSVAMDRRWHTAYAVVRRADERIVGMVNYHERRPAHARLALGWLLLPEFRGQGLAREAAGALIGHCLTALDANRIEARIEPGNMPSLALAQRLGFRREALLREWMRVAGQPRDIVLLTLLKKEWRGL